MLLTCGVDWMDRIRYGGWNGVSSKSKCSLSQFGEYQAKCDEKKCPKMMNARGERAKKN